jgi:preprotein translocase subunit SecF
MNIVKYQNYFFIVPALAVGLSLAALLMWGLKPGIDLAGGSLLQVSYQAPVPSQDTVRNAVSALGLGEVRVQPAEGEWGQGYVLRQRELSAAEHEELLDVLATIGTAREEQFTSIGPSIGQELLRKAWVAIALVVAATILFIAFAFRHVSKPVASWKYGVVAIVTLAHDILVPVGLFALLGHLWGTEVDALFIVALLTILGVSINDTIVVFDRIRENLRGNEEARRNEAFDVVVGKSISQTIARSVNTSLTVVIVLLALFVWGPEATRAFALTLTVGMLAGTYSSIFLAAPSLVAWERWSRKN